MSFAGTADSIPTCVVCESGKHPIYMCAKFKAFPHEKMLSTVKANGLCINCLKSGHFVQECKSSHRCRKCNRSHHTLLHLEPKQGSQIARDRIVTPAQLPQSDPLVTAHAAVGVKSNLLMMTCLVVVESPDKSSVTARALLDSASSVSFVSERLAQSLGLSRTSQTVHVTGVAGLRRSCSLQSVTNFAVSAIHSPREKIGVTAIVVPRVTCDLPLQPVSFHSSWTHLSGITLADPDFGRPGRVDLLLGVEVFPDVMLHGRRCGPPESPAAFETRFGWVLAGSVADYTSAQHAVVHHVCIPSGDDILRKF